MARLRTRKSRTRKSRTRKSRIRRINKFKKYIGSRKNIQKRSNRLKKSYRGTSKHRRFKTIKKRGKYRQSRKKLYGGTGKIGVIVGKEELKASSPLEDDAKLNASWQNKMVFIKHNDGIWRWAQIMELLGTIMGVHWVCTTIKCKLNQAGKIQTFKRPPAFSKQNLLIPYEKLYLDRTHMFITHTDEKSNLQVLLKRKRVAEILDEDEVPWKSPANDWIELYCQMIGHRGEDDDEILAFVAKHRKQFIPSSKQFEQVRLSYKVSKLKKLIHKYSQITVNQQTIFPGLSLMSSTWGLSNSDFLPLLLININLSSAKLYWHSTLTHSSFIRPGIFCFRVPLTKLVLTTKSRYIFCIRFAAPPPPASLVPPQSFSHHISPSDQPPPIFDN